MYRTPTNLPEEKLARFETSIGEFQTRVDEHVDSILRSVDRKSVRNQLESIVFNSNPALPKRPQRPIITAPFLTEQVYLAHSEGQLRDQLVQFTLIHLEYYDIFDDLMDGDVAEERVMEVLVTHELLQPLITRWLNALGDSALSYWSERTTGMLCSFINEEFLEASTNAYNKVIEDQSKLFGTLTGMSAIISDKDDDVVSRAETLGELYFKFDQFILDGEQYVSGDPDPWNAWNLIPEDEVIVEIHSLREDIDGILADFPEERAELIRPLVALDIDEWQTQL